MKEHSLTQSFLHDKEARWQFLTSDPAAQQPTAMGQYRAGHEENNVYQQQPLQPQDQLRNGHNTVTALCKNTFSIKDVTANQNHLMRCHRLKFGYTGRFLEKVQPQK